MLRIEHDILIVYHERTWKAFHYDFKLSINVCNARQSEHRLCSCLPPNHHHSDDIAFKCQHFQTEQHRR